MLYEDKSKIVYILEELGCHKINANFGENQIRCAMPDGETGTSLSVTHNKTITCKVFSRSDYEDDYEFQDIISLVQYINNIKYTDSIKWLCSILNIDFNGTYIKSNVPTIIKDLKKREQLHNKNKTLTRVTHKKINQKVLNKYKEQPVVEWINEGIPASIQRKYKVMIDEEKMRWIIPIFDDESNLVSLKGRTYVLDYDKYNIPKYLYYYKIGRNDILYGYNLHKNNIKAKNEIILFEGEKSVMKADQYGYNWAVSVGKCGINPYLENKILSLKCNVVIAFDNDVDYAKLVKEAKKLSKYTNVFIIYDNNKILGQPEEKMSPVDKGKETWEMLYRTKIRI